MFLAESAPGSHPLTSICGTQPLDLVVIKFFYCAITIDTLVSSAIAIAVTLALAFFVASRLRPGVPSKLQMVLEFLVTSVRGMVRDTVHEEATFIIPIAATIGFYILVANWLDFFPLGFSPLIKPANSDLNQTLAMAIVVILVVQWYSVKVLGLRGYLRRFTKPFEMNWIIRALFVPLNIIEEIAKPITLSLRLFGNIFAGVLMVYLLSQLAVWLVGLYRPAAIIAWLPVFFWKAFDVFFVGTIQAFIFTLLTIIYFQQAREGLEEDLHGSPRSHAAPARTTQEVGGHTA